MTKKKNGIFSKIKNKLRGENVDDEIETDVEDTLDDDEYEYVDEDEEDDDEYEYVDEDDDEEEEDEGENEDQDDAQQSPIEQPQVMTRSQDEDEDEDEEIEYEDDDEIENALSEGTIEIEIEVPEEPGFLQKMKSKFSKGKNDEDEDDYYEDEDDLEEDEDSLDLQASNSNKNAMQSMIDRFKKMKPSYTNEKEFKTSSSDTKFNELSPEQWLPHLLSDQNRNIVHKSFITGLTITGFFFAGKFLGLWLGSTSKSKGFSPQRSVVSAYNPRKDVNSIRDNNIFNAKESLSDKPRKSKEPKKPVVKVCKAANKKSRLPIKLVNTIVLQDSVKSVASVSKRGKVFNFREGEKIDNLAEVGKINRLKLVFKNLKSGSCEYIENVDKKAKRAFAKKKLNVEAPRKLAKNGIQGKGNKFSIKKSVRDQLLSNIGEVLTQARAIQIKNPDGTLSYKMADVVPGSIYSQLNIQNGDIVTGINGKKITSMNEMMSMFGKLKENDSYEITISRDGNEQNLNYNFTE